MAWITGALEDLECPSKQGDYRRHPDPDSRHSACDRLTRDQATGIATLMLAGTYARNEELKKECKGKCRKFMWNMLKRLWFTNNKSHHGWLKDDPRNGTSWRDFAGLSLMAICIRVTRWWLHCPLLVILDIELVYSAVQYRCFDNRDDVLNHVLRCSSAGMLYPTPCSHLANMINDPDDMAEKIRRYFVDRDHFNGILQKMDGGPPMETVWDAELLRRVM